MYFNYQLLGITKGELMTDWKPKNLKDELENCICSALNDNARTTEVGGAVESEYIMDDDFDIVVKQAIKEIQKSDYINIKFKE